MRRLNLDTFESVLKSGNSEAPIKSGEQWDGYPRIDSNVATPSDENITAWMNISAKEFVLRPDIAHVYTFIPDTVVTTTTSTTSSSSSTVSTSSSSSSTISTTSTLSTTSSSSSSSSTVSTTSSTISTTSTLSTVSTSSSSSSTLSTTSSSSSTSSTISTTSTLSTTSTSSSSSSTVSTSSSSTSTSSSSSTTTTYWCEYNDRFNDIDLWQVEVAGGATVTSVANEIKLTIPDDPAGSAIADYQYFIGSGDYDLEIDFTDYSPNDSSNGQFVYVLNYDTVVGTAQELASVRYNVTNAGATHNVVSQLRVGGDNQDNTVNPASRPSKFRFVRDSSTLKIYYYIASWVLVDSRDFGGSAGNIVKIRLLSIDKSSHGGYSTFDNLVFHDGCPDGYPKAWTTTTSTSSSTTTTTT